MRLETAIEHAISFLLAQRRDGMWTDFWTGYHASAEDWVTAYVAGALHLAGVGISRTLDRLIARGGRQQAWGYNLKAPPDADTTAFVARTLSAYHAVDVQAAKSFIRSHQCPDGGISGFTESNIRQCYRMADIGVKGWISSSADVTANAALVLPDAGLRQYLISAQRADGSLGAYWWNSDIYATAFAVRSLPGPQRKQAEQWLAAQKPVIPFYQALRIWGLLGTPAEIAGDAKKLAQQQLRDGSWLSYPILRLPHPANPDPWNIPSRWVSDRPDQHRIFTTAACLTALVGYRKARGHSQPF